MAIKKSKRWCKTKCGRYVSDVDRFAQVDNKDRRVSLEDIRSTVSMVKYVKDSAKRKNVSVSLRFEQIFLYVMFHDLLKGVILPMRKKHVKEVRLVVSKEDRKKFPKIYMHPTFKKLLQEDARRRGMSLSFYVYHFLLVYKVRTRT